MAANVTVVSTSIKANAGKAVPGGVRVARASPTNATTPRTGAIRASARAAGVTAQHDDGHGTATSTGAALG